MYKLDQPLFLLFFILLIPGIYLWKRKKPQGILFTSFISGAFLKTWRIRLLFLPGLFYILAVLGFILALCRPVYQQGDTRDIKEGIVMEVILDRSGSMGTWMDKELTTNRLDIVKKTFLEFLEEREDDIIGLTIFAGYADTLSPLTVSHGVFPQFIDSISLAEKEADGTAIGDAIALGIARIESFRKGLEKKSDAVIILLTDGQNNRGELKPMEAAEMAAARNITIYTIGFGGGYYRNAFGFLQEIPPEYEVDGKTLTEVAEKTGGMYFNAEDESSLRKIYSKIDRMEQTEIENITFTRKDELFQFVLLISLAFLFAGILLNELLIPAVEHDL